MADKAAKIIRVTTVPPVMALVLAIILFIGKAFTLASLLRMAACVAGFPLLAYILCWSIPALRKKGRPFERSVAIAFSVAGYAAGTLFCIFGSGTREELIVFLSYLISGALIAVFSALFHFKASGHAAGVAGPVMMLTVTFGPIYLLGYLFSALVFWSSIRLKRHTLAQLLVGGAFSSIAVLALSVVL